MNVKETIETLIKDNSIMLFMKGTPTFPQCGFSGQAVHLLKQCGVNEIGYFNVLEDEDVRQGIKDYSNWPTIPQLYVKGEFVGGADIMIELFESGELEKLVNRHSAT